MRSTGLGLLLCGMAMSCKSDTPKTETTTDPFAGRQRHTIVYSGNMWGDLLDCG